MGYTKKANNGNEKKKPPNIDLKASAPQSHSALSPSTMGRLIAIKNVIETTEHYYTFSVDPPNPDTFPKLWQQVLDAQENAEDGIAIQKTQKHLSRILIMARNLIDLSKGDDGITEDKIRALGPEVVQHIDEVLDGTWAEDVPASWKLKPFIVDVFDRLSLSAAAKDTHAHLAADNRPESRSEDKSSLENKSSTSNPTEEAVSNTTEPASSEPASPKIANPTPSGPADSDEEAYKPANDPQVAPRNKYLKLIGAICFFLVLIMSIALFSKFLGLLGSFIPQLRHPSDPQTPVLFPNGTKVGFDMTDQLQAFSELMENTVTLYDTFEKEIDTVIGDLIFETSQLINSLETIEKPPWWGDSAAMLPLLNMLGVRMPRKDEADQISEEYLSKTKAIMSEFPAEKRDELVSAFDQLDAHLGGIQNSVLGHDVQLQFSKFFHGLAQMNSTIMLEKIITDEVAGCLTMLRIFNEKYRELGEGYVLELYDRAEDFVIFLQGSLFNVGESLPYKITLLKDRKRRLGEAYQDAVRLKQSMQVTRKEKHELLAVMAMFSIKI